MIFDPERKLLPEFTVCIQQSASGKHQHPDTGKILEGLERILFSRIEDDALFASAQLLYCALAILDSRRNFQLLISVQVTSDWQKTMPNLGLQFPEDTTRFRQKRKILLPETVLNRSFHHLSEQSGKLLPHAV